MTTIIVDKIKEKVIIKLSSVDNELLPDYSTNLIAITNEFEINQLKNTLIEILEDTNLPKETMLAYNAFYTLTICCRRYYDIIEMTNCIDKYAHYFQDRKTYNAIMCIYFTRLAEIKKDINLFSNALKYAETCMELMSNNVGVIHLYPDVVATTYLQGFSFNKDTYYKSLELIKKCIVLKPEYGRYYYTYSRLLLINNEFDEAEHNMKLAIQFENVNNNGLLKFKRTSEYNIFLLRIENQRLLLNMRTQANENLNNQMKKIDDTITAVKQNIEKDIENTNRKNIELLGVFTAIITFVIAIINTTLQSKDFITSFCLILVFSGTQILVYTTLKLIISSDIAFKSILKYIIIGAILILLSLLVNLIYPTLLYLV